MKITLFNSAVLAVAAFMNDTCEVVVVDGVRVNKSDYEADQAKEPGDRVYGKMDSDKKQSDAAEDTAAVTTIGVQTNIHPDLTMPPSPAAPNFTDQGAGAQAGAANPTPVDPATGAAVPTVPSPNQKFVMQKGKKFVVTDANGNPVTGVDGIDEGGYLTQDAATAAVQALPH